MMYATRDGVRVLAQPGLTAVCPGCGGETISKCGEINIWHWAHRFGEDCDSWHEPETAWHREWKTLVRPEFREVTIGPHRADMVGNGGVVIEVQHSAISAEEIAERERFYGNMIWIFDAATFEKNISQHALDMENYNFKWRHPRKSLWRVQKQMFWDFDYGKRSKTSAAERSLFCVGMVKRMPCIMWGTWWRSEFFDRYLSEVAVQGMTT